MIRSNDPGVSPSRLHVWPSAVASAQMLAGVESTGSVLNCSSILPRFLRGRVAKHLEHDRLGEASVRIENVWSNEELQMSRGTSAHEVDPQTCIDESSYHRRHARSRSVAESRSATRPSRNPVKSTPHSPLRNFSATPVLRSRTEASTRASVWRPDDCSRLVRSRSAIVSSSSRPSWSARDRMSSIRSSGSSTRMISPC
jgi:hypothetical protein